MPDSMIAIISNVVATGRMMKGRDGLMDALLSNRSGAVGCYWAPRDRRPLPGPPGGGAAVPFAALPGARFPVVVFPSELAFAAPAPRPAAAPAGLPAGPVPPPGLPS